MIEFKPRNMNEEADRHNLNDHFGAGVDASFGAERNLVSHSEVPWFISRSC